jgi:hypothetical protein
MAERVNRHHRILCQVLSVGIVLFIGHAQLFSQTQSAPVSTPPRSAVTVKNIFRVKYVSGESVYLDAGKQCRP